MTGLVPAQGRPLVRALIAFDELTLTAATRKGAGLLKGSARPSAPGAVRVLLREYARARRMRRELGRRESFAAHEA